jgi:hypothetical protein
LRVLLFITSVLMGLLTAACNISSDLDRFSLTNGTDYLVGQNYQLKKPAFIFKNDRSNPKDLPFLAPLGFSGTPTNTLDFQKHIADNHQVAGLLHPGDTLRVINLSKHRLFNVGRSLEAHAVVASGPHTGTNVELSMISKGGRPAPTIFVNPDYLVPAKPSS